MTNEEIKQLAIAVYGNDPNSFGQQRDGYLKGYQDAQEQDNWISVKDKLPTPNEVVLIFWDNKITSGSYKDFHNGYFQHGAATQLKVTHWQPLPNPPKSK